MTNEPQRVAAIQMASGPNVSANLLEAERFVAEAAEAGAGLVVLPENFGFMGKSEQDLLSVREAEGTGPVQSFLSQTARRHGVWLVGGTVPIEAQDSGHVRAACLVYNARGERAARYDKMHLFDVHLPEVDERYAESESIEPGDRVVVVDSPFGRLGIAVCYDLRFPELFRSMREVDVICLPAAFTAITGRAHWEVLVRARAIENLAYVVAAGQGGFHISGRETHGQSMIVDPWGMVLAELRRGTGPVTAELRLDYLAATRRSFPTLEHRRLDRL
ncbi:MAG: carbon-nitrogen hydrolase family protein [Chromatiales bacterium]|jgi:nitrilase